METLLTWARQPPNVVPTAAAYVHAVIPSLPVFLLFIAFRQTLQAFHRLTPIIVSVIVANIVNAALGWATVFGHRGFEPLGAVGAAWATTVSRWLMVAVLLLQGRTSLARSSFQRSARVVATGILRGAADTRAPMLMNPVGYFVLGVPIAALLGFALGYGAVGIWWGLVVGLVGAASLLTYRVKTRLASEIARVTI